MAFNAITQCLIIGAMRKPQAGHEEVTRKPSATDEDYAVTDIFRIRKVKVRDLHDVSWMVRRGMVLVPRLLRVSHSVTHTHTRARTHTDTRTPTVTRTAAGRTHTRHSGHRWRSIDIHLSGRYRRSQNWIQKRSVEAGLFASRLSTGRGTPLRLGE